jgi:ammonium transporter, Amt family
MTRLYPMRFPSRSLAKIFGLVGGSGFFLSPSFYTPAVAALFLFQMIFMDTAATIPTGAMAERWKFLSFCLFSVVIASAIYPIYANWVWGGGWLSALGKNFDLGHGHIDFAGSSVVHMTGGVMALVGAKMIKPRVGKYTTDGKVNPIPAHNVRMVVTGTLVLAFGWFGFNPGSTLASSDVRISVIATNTMLASASGALFACVFVWLRFGKPDVTMICNGLLAGLVAITAPCAFVSAGSAVLVGAVAGVLVVVAALFVEHSLKIDDPVGAVAVHGVCGAWGILSVGLFSNGTYGEGLNGVDGPVKGLLYGDPGQLVASCIGILVNVVWVGTVSIAALWVIDKLVGNRVSEQSEIEGLDHGEMGMPGYVAEAGRASPPEMAPSIPPSLVVASVQRGA